MLAKLLTVEHGYGLFMLTYGVAVYLQPASSGVRFVLEVFGTRLTYYMVAGVFIAGGLMLFFLKTNVAQLWLCCTPLTIYCASFLVHSFIFGTLFTPISVVFGSVLFILICYTYQRTQKHGLG